jgi:hypothetical protein
MVNVEVSLPLLRDYFVDTYLIHIGVKGSSLYQGSNHFFSEYWKGSAYTCVRLKLQLLYQFNNTTECPPKKRYFATSMLRH